MTNRNHSFRTVRITGGDLRGRTILTPGDGTHPMGERERLALFNTLSSMMEPDKIAEYGPVLDAYAGSGALGIEAISRGAQLVLFVEKEACACQTIRSNLDRLGICARILKANVSEAVAETTEKFGVIFADPPYDKYDQSKIAKLTCAVADPNGILVLSHPGEAPELPHMKLYKSRKYAGATISFYRHENWREFF